MISGRSGERCGGDQEEDRGREGGADPDDQQGPGQHDQEAGGGARPKEDRTDGGCLIVVVDVLIQSLLFAAIISELMESIFVLQTLSPHWICQPLSSS